MNRMTINEVQDQIIELGNQLESYEEKNKTVSNLIQGCQSRVWLNGEYENGRIIFTADSDAIITKGIIALLIRVLSDRSPTEVINSELYFIDKIGLKENLSPTRANGLVSMIKNMKAYGLAYSMKEK
jgi:cysteine desulfuration protein SufE